MNYNKLLIIGYLFFLTLIIGSCKGQNEKSNTKEDNNSVTELTSENQEELNYVLVDSFPIGDIRRYGIKINGGDPRHPNSDKSTTQAVFEMASKENIEIFFPQGYYKFGLYFKGIDGLKVKFDNAEFGGGRYLALLTCYQVGNINTQARNPTVI